MVFDKVKITSTDINKIIDIMKKASWSSLPVAIPNFEWDHIDFGDELLHKATAIFFSLSGNILTIRVGPLDSEPFFVCEWDLVTNEKRYTEEKVKQKDFNLPSYYRRVYYAVQFYFFNKPEHQVISRKVTDIETYINAKGKTKKRYVRKIIRTVQISTSDVDSVVKSHREISCPCWSVVGHWRKHPKTGELTVWVSPYRKGKKRNDPEALVAKDYVE